MSTGDQSEYLRKKMAERRISSALGGQPQFMKSGFQRWAENERPTRMGGAEKEPMEKARDGAKDILPALKKVSHQMFQKFYDYEGGAHYQSGSECESESEDEGGRVDFLRRPTTKGNGYSGNGMLEEHAHDLLKMAKKGSGKLECLHYEEGEGTVVKKGKGRTSSKIRPTKASLEAAEGEVEERGSGLTKVMKHGNQWIVGEKEGQAVKVIGGPFVSKKEAQEYFKAAIALVKASKDKPKEGKGYKQGIQESKKAFNELGDVAIHGLDAYEKGNSGNVWGAMDDVKAGYEAGMRAKKNIEDAAKEFKEGSGRQVGAGKKRSSARGEIVKRIMREKGLSLPQASKYVKEHNLYKG